MVLGLSGGENGRKWAKMCHFWLFLKIDFEDLSRLRLLVAQMAKGGGSIARTGFLKSDFFGPTQARI